MAYKEQPTKDVIISQLQKVIKKVISREEFNHWAFRWVENFDCRNHLSCEEDEIHSYLIYLLGIDLEIEEGVYFHEDKEIKKWIKKIKGGKLL